VCLGPHRFVERLLDIRVLAPTLRRAVCRAIEEKNNTNLLKSFKALTFFKKQFQRLNHILEKHRQLKVGGAGIDTFKVYLKK